MSTSIRSTSPSFMNSLISSVGLAGTQLIPKIGARASYATDIHGGTVVVELIEEPVRAALDDTGENLAEAFAKGANGG